jgi:hypothetical protein
MMRILHPFFLVVFLFISAMSSLHAQGAIYGFAGGLSFSSEQITGFQQQEFLRPHAIAFIESTSDISPNALYARLGYHVKGAEIQTYTYYDEMAVAQPAEVPAMQFHNLSTTIGFKQRRPLGGLWYSYGFGLRLDYNLKADYGKFFMVLDGAENKVTYGVDVDVAMEFPISEYVSAFLEFGVSPDLSEQIFIPLHNNGWYQYNGVPISVGETKLTHLVYEVRAGFRFWHKVIYTD